MEKSLSRHLKLNCTDVKQYDEQGNLAEGTRMGGEDKKTIYRFHKGLLDGDIYDNKGNVIITKPAIEGAGHIEYWRQNKLHRDKGQPAVLSKGFTVREFWENGVRVNDPNIAQVKEKEQIVEKQKTFNIDSYLER